MAITETVTIADDEATIDLILFRRFKRPTPGLFERVLDLNRDIAEPGQFLAVGSKLVLPVDAPNESPVEIVAVRLWD